MQSVAGNLERVIADLPRGQRALARRIAWKCGPKGGGLTWAIYQEIRRLRKGHPERVKYAHDLKRGLAGYPGSYLPAEHARALDAMAQDIEKVA